MRRNALLFGSLVCIACTPGGTGSAPNRNTPPVVVVFAAPEVVNPGERVTFDATGTEDNEGDIVEFYYRYGDGGEVRTTSPVAHHIYTIPGEFTVVVRATDAEGLWDENFARVRVLGGEPPPPPPPPPMMNRPMITQQPVDQTVNPGTPVSFSVQATGDEPLTYQWRKDGNEISGANSALLQIPAAQDADEGAYSCIVSNAAGNAVSDRATLVVTDVPQITVQPVSQVAAEGTPVLFWVVAVGNPAPSFQWQKDGNDIAGATTNELEIAMTRSTDEGTYTVVVSNTAGQVTSDPATLMVEVPMVPTQAPRITSVPTTEVYALQRYTYPISAIGQPMPSVEVAGLPSSLMFDGQTLIEGDVELTDVGMHEITVTASNTHGLDTQTFTLNVLSGAPQITSTPVTRATQGAPYTYNLTGSGFPPPIFLVSGLPSNLAFDGRNRITGTPGPEDLGDHTITVTATNAQGQDSQTYTLTVAPPEPLEETFESGSLPMGWSASGDWAFGVPTAGPTSVPEGMQVAGTQLSGNYSDMTTSILDTPPMDLRGMPRPALQILHWFRTEPEYDGGNIKISDDGGQNFRQLDPMSIHGDGYPGTILANSGSSVAGEPAYVGDSNGWAYVFVNLEPNLPNGMDNVVLRFEFGTDQRLNEAGWFLDSVRVNDLDMLPQTPRFRSTPVTAAADGMPYEYVLDVAGWPRPGVRVAGLPSSLAFDGQAIRGTPTSGDVGDHMITITATNTYGMADQTYTLNVATNAPVINSAAPGGAMVGVPFTHTFSVLGATPIALSVAGLPTSLVFDGQRMISGTPTMADEGDHMITVTATSAFGTDSQTFTLSITDGPILSESFESMPAGWSMTGDWQVGVATVGPSNAADGSGVAGTLLGANYTNTLRSSLDTPVLDLSNVTDPVLKFSHWHDTESSYDGGNIKVSYDGGQNFLLITSAAILSTPYNGTLDTRYLNPMGGQRAWTGATSDWTEVLIDLEPVLGTNARTQVVLRFDFGTDSGVQDRGWYLDLVQVGAAADLNAPPPPGGAPPP